MDEEKRKKLDSGRALLDTYQKKRHDLHGQASHYNTSVDKISSDDSKALDRFIQLDAVTLIRNKEQFDSLGSTIKQLHESLSDKDEIITSLEIQNKILREGGGDHINAMSSEDGRVQELLQMLESRNKYITQLSDSLLNRDQELRTAFNREKELSLEVNQLQQDISLKTKQSETKHAESHHEIIEYKAKVAQLTNQIKEYSSLVKSMKTSMESNSRKFEERQEQLIEHSKKLEKYKTETSRDIMDLMKQVEEQNNVIAIKENELFQIKTELENVRGIQEVEFSALKRELEDKYREELVTVQQMFDEMMLKYIRNSDLKNAEDIEKQIASYTDSYEQDLKNLLERSKSTEDQLKSELKKHKDNAEYYKQQVEHIRNSLSEEMKNIKYECEQSLNLYQDKVVALKKGYKHDIQSLSEELHFYKDGYKQQAGQILDYENNLKYLNERKLQLKENLTQCKKTESNVINKLNVTTKMLHDCEAEICRLREEIQNSANTFEMKYREITQTYNDKLSSVMKELDESKLFHDEDLANLTSKIEKQQNVIKHLEGELRNIVDYNKQEADISNNEIDHLKRNLVVAENMSDAKDMFLLDLLRGLRDIRTYIKLLTYSDDEGTLVESASSEEMIVNEMSYEVITGILQNTVHEILDMSQSLHMSTNMVTSTPNVKLANSWMLKCTRLEEEKDLMANQLELLTANIKQMEYCLTVATEESGKFNTKCQILDAKLTELEHFRLSRSALKKENNDLKGQLEILKENEVKFQNELSSLTAKNDKLEEIVNRNVSDLYEKLSQERFTTELSDILVDLKEKSEDVNQLKSKLSDLQQVEEDYKFKLSNMESKINTLNTEKVVLKNNLDIKTKDLETLWKERNKISSENKLLQSKILTMQQKYNIFGLKSTHSKVDNCWSDETDQTESIPAEASVNAFSLNRMHTLHVLSAARSLSNVMSKSSNMSVYEQIEDQLQLLDKQVVSEGQPPMTMAMPTIPEEDQDTCDEPQQSQV